MQSVRLSAMFCQQWYWIFCR